MTNERPQGEQPQNEEQPRPQNEQTETQTDAPSQQRVNQPVQPEPKPTGEDHGEKEVAENRREELEKGYRGTVPDETPNENYTVRGVTSGAPRPDAQEEPLSPGERGNE